MKKVRILIACEKSGVVREAFEKFGGGRYDVWSCDLQPTDIPGKHFQCDVREVLNMGWDFIIAFPDCTYLTVTGNKWFKPEYKDRFPDREERRQKAIEFFMMFANADCPRIVIENPVGIMSRVYRKPNQIICPTQFGHKEPKKTCLWLKGVPPLRPTKFVEPEYHTTAGGKRIPTWYSRAQKKDRANIRSKTFQGVADAMASQWGSTL